MSNPGASQIRTVEIIASLALCVFCANFATSVIWNEIYGYKAARANSGMSILAEQMGAANPTTQQRKIASFENKTVPKNVLRDQGVIGNDPWGNAYNYKYFRNEKGNITYLLLLSSGKNAQIETKISDLNLSQMSGGRYDFTGDDFGFIKKFDN
jgi:hypothetical protein